MPKFRKERDMNFKDAFELMKKGHKVKLPSWVDIGIGMKKKKLS
jgi:hypothetical protein